MTNETLEKKLEKRILIVEDNPMYALEAFRTAETRGYQVDVAFDLEDALKYLDEQRYDGVLTDMTFQQRGVNIAPKISDAERALREVPGFSSFKERYNLAKSKKQHTDSELRKIVGEASANAIDEKMLEAMNKKVTNSKYNLSGFRKAMVLLNSESLDSMESHRNPALGYFIIKKAQEKGTPVVVSTIHSHADHAVPAILASGLLSPEELKEHLRCEELPYYEGEKLKKMGLYRSFVPLDKMEPAQIRSMLFNKEWLLDSLKNYAQTSTSDREFFQEFQKRDLSDENSRGVVPFVLDRVIIGRKDSYGYNLSIDQLEGIIDQTRPYILIPEGESILEKEISRERVIGVVSGILEEIRIAEQIKAEQQIETPKISDEPKKSIWNKLFGRIKI